MPVLDDFDIVERAIGEVREGEILVENEWLSLDPSARLRMNDAPSAYLTPFELGEALQGWAVGRVVDSTSQQFAIGEYVIHSLGWRDSAVVPVGTGQWTDPRRIDVSPEHPARARLGALGPSGLTSWAGLLLTAELRPGDVVFVSAAAGAVGSLVLQIAKRRGHRVIGSAGSAEKVDFVVSTLGADEAFCYRDETPAEALPRLAPEGIDVYFDCVGGDHLDAALIALRQGGRVALCGAFSGYNGGGPGIGNLFSATEKNLTLRGFLARNYRDRIPDFVDEVSAWLADGSIVFAETVVDGLDATPAGFIGMLGGATVGKTLVRLYRENARMTSLWVETVIDDVAIARFTNPPLNYQTDQSVRELSELIEGWSTSDVAAVVLCGGLPGIFITHFSPDEIQAGVLEPQQIITKGAVRNTAVNRALDALSQLPMPVIAALNGDAMGFGFELALACDIRIGQVGDHRYGLPEVRLGILPGSGGTHVTDSRETTRCLDIESTKRFHV